MANSKKAVSLYIRNTFFGIEDGIVSTVGLLSGVAAAGIERGTVFLTGTILIIVEAFSMAVGSYISEQSVEEYQRRKEASESWSIKAGLVMFFSYVGAGFIALFPYALFSVQNAFWISIILSLLAIILLGVWQARLARLNIVKHGLKMLFVGGIAIGVGILVGNFLKDF